MTLTTLIFSRPSSNRTATIRDLAVLLTGYTIDSLRTASEEIFGRLRIRRQPEDGDSGCDRNAR